MGNGRWFAFAVTLGVLGLVAPLRASAQSQRSVYAHAQLAGGYWHYWQANYAPREFDGGTFEFRGAFAWAFIDELAIGTTIGVDLFYGSGRSFGSSGHSYAAEPAPGGLWGLFLVWIPAGETPPVSIELSAGIAGGGTPHWGGGGPFVSPGITFFLAHAGRSHLGLTLRAQYEPMYSVDATPSGAEKNFVTATAAIGWVFF